MINQFRESFMYIQTSLSDLASENVGENLNRALDKITEIFDMMPEYQEDLTRLRESILQHRYSLNSSNVNASGQTLRGVIQEIYQKVFPPIELSAAAAAAQVVPMAEEDPEGEVLQQEVLQPAATEFLMENPITVMAVFDLFESISKGEKGVQLKEALDYFSPDLLGEREVIKMLLMEGLWMEHPPEIFECSNVLSDFPSHKPKLYNSYWEWVMMENEGLGKEILKEIGPVTLGQFNAFSQCILMPFLQAENKMDFRINVINQAIAKHDYFAALSLALELKNQQLKRNCILHIVNGISNRNLMIAINSILERDLRSKVSEISEMVNDQNKVDIILACLVEDCLRIHDDSIPPGDGTDETVAPSVELASEYWEGIQNHDLTEKMAKTIVRKFVQGGFFQDAEQWFSYMNDNSIHKFGAFKSIAKGYIETQKFDEAEAFIKDFPSTTPQIKAEKKELLNFIESEREAAESDEE